jgi:hypothetical protein
MKSRAAELRMLNTVGSEFPFYGEERLRVERRSGRFAVHLPNPNFRLEQRWTYEDPEYDQAEPKVDFMVSKKGFTFFTSTTVAPRHPMHTTIKGHLEEDYEEGELKFWGDRINRVFGYDNPQIHIKL